MLVDGNVGALWAINLASRGDQFFPSRSMAHAVTNIFRATAMIACFFRDLEPPRTRSYRSLKYGLNRIAHQATSVRTERSKRGPRRLIRFCRSILPLCHFLGASPAYELTLRALKSLGIVDMCHDHLRSDNADSRYRLDNLDAWIGLGNQGQLFLDTTHQLQCCD